MPPKQPPDQLKQLLAESIKASGFPFQAKIQNLIESNPKWRYWQPNAHGAMKNVKSL